jgi:hypothetical protein
MSNQIYRFVWCYFFNHNKLCEWFDVTIEIISKNCNFFPSILSSVEFTVIFFGRNRFYIPPKLKLRLFSILCLLLFFCCAPLMKRWNFSQLMEDIPDALMVARMLDHLVSHSPLTMIISKYQSHLFWWDSSHTIWLKYFYYSPLETLSLDNK